MLKQHATDARADAWSFCAGGTSRQPATKRRPSSCQATAAGALVCSRGAALTVIVVLALLPLAPRRGPACPAGLARSLVIPPTALLQRRKALKDVCASAPVLTPLTCPARSGICMSSKWWRFCRQQLALTELCEVLTCLARAFLLVYHSMRGCFCCSPASCGDASHQIGDTLIRLPQSVPAATCVD